MSIGAVPNEFLFTQFQLDVDVVCTKNTINRSPCARCKHHHFKCDVKEPFTQSLCKRCWEKGLDACLGSTETQNQAVVSNGGTGSDGKPLLEPSGSPVKTTPTPSPQLTNHDSTAHRALHAGNSLPASQVEHSNAATTASRLIHTMLTTKNVTPGQPIIKHAIQC
ncbi:hypothetical protein BD410DRAFT_896319 [Rickenella mellea]|uniref:Uncharacterized protein n=1 Tax=Rickenella mellea TaxID=50990 RepID=A0A4Y7QCP3_9AGAM|nr:hypothetical protein BD410DRAFT_896319 [Rickenella mellea]